MSVRKLIFKVHLLLGLVLGGFFLLLGLTGSFLVFYPEIDLLLHPEIRVQHQSANLQVSNATSLQLVLNKLKTEYPNLKNGWRIEMPLQDDFPIFARYLKPYANSSATFAPLVVSVDPYSLEITSSRIWGDYFVTWVFDLHYQLLMGEIGKSFIVIVGILLILNLFAGLYLWFPKSIQAFNHALSFKMTAHPMRKNYDIHKLVGVFSLVLLLAIAFTGALLGRADWFNPVINQISVIESYKPLPLKIENSSPISADDVIAIAKAAYPTAEIRWIYSPDSESDYYQVRMYQANEPGRRFPKTILWINPYSGQVKHIKNPESFSGGDILLAWLHPLHNGEAFGTIGRLLAVLSGLIIMVLFWTGMKRTIYKHNVKKFMSSKTRAS